jgi:hypothetical protein
LLHLPLGEETPLIRKNQEASNNDRFYKPGEQVPHTGVYHLLHESGRTGTVVLLQGKEFPVCADCGQRVQFRLERAAPHIREDRDFR